MLRFLAGFCLIVLLALQATDAAGAEPADKGPPYTDAQFMELAPYRLPNGFARILPNWWPRAPGYLRQRVLSSRSEMWWFIIECNGMGFKPDGMPPGGADKCEQDAFKASQRAKSNWAPDGSWVGPSEACKKRDKRTEYGELICD